MNNRGLLIIIGMFFVLVVSSCLNKNNDEDLFTKKLANKCNFEEDSIILSINRITSFKWDTLYIIAPYTSNNEVNKIVGIKYVSDNLKQAFVDNESYTRFLFKNYDKIVKDFEVYDSDIGKSFGYLNDNTFSKESAVFIVKKNEYQIKIKK